MKRHFGLESRQTAPQGKPSASLPAPEMRADNVIQFPPAGGSWPTSSRRQPTTRGQSESLPRVFSDSAVRDIAALIFAAVVFGIPGIGATILLVGYLLFVA